jgi:lambda repressor-like predicted transcriptional regulator
MTDAGLGDAFLVKLDSSGNVQWAKHFGSPYPDELLAVAVDGSGNIFVTGDAYGVIDFGGGPLSNAGSADAVVAKLDPAGNHVWSKSYGDGAAQRGRAIAVASTGHVMIAGQAAGDVDFGCGVMHSAGGDPVTSGDVVLARLDLAGACVWSRRYGDADIQDVAGMALDPSGNVILAGNLQGSINLGGSMLTSAGGSDVFVAKLDSSGGHQWSIRAGDSDEQLCQGVATDSAGNVIVTGYFRGTMDFGGTTLIGTAGNVDIFLAKLHGTTGNEIWSKRFGDAQAQYATGVTADAAGDAVLTGYFLGTLDFGGNALVSAGARDIFVTKFAP